MRRSREFTPEARLDNFWNKGRWYRLPSYRQSVFRTDICDAVLRHGVRTPAQINRYLLAQGKPMEGIL